MVVNSISIITDIEEANVASFFLYVVAVLCIAATILYIWHIIKWIKVWENTPKEGTQKTQEQISVVIALHNEEKKVRQLSETLKKTSVEEIIAVCDHCTDKTEDIIAEYQDERTKILTNDQQAGKKTAQRLGVKYARNNYVAVVDGDCMVRERWADAVKGKIAKERPDMIIMPVAMRANDNRLSQRLMELEFLSLQMVTASTALEGKATMCNGANMAFRRDVYLGHDGNTEYISGDDMFLLSEVKRRNGKVVYLKNGDAMVETKSPESIKAYYRQRTRWLRKASGYKDWDVINLSMLVMAGNMAWPLAGLTLQWEVMVACLICKTVAEYALIRAGRTMWKTEVRIKDVIILALSYPFVLLSIAIMTLFRDKKKWQ